MHEDVMKIVEFNKYCCTCEHFNKKEDEEPCFTCLAEPENANSHKPVKWEEASMKAQNKKEENEEAN